MYDKPEDQNPAMHPHRRRIRHRQQQKKATGLELANTIYTGKLSDAAGHNQWNSLDTHGEHTTRGHDRHQHAAGNTSRAAAPVRHPELNSIGQLAGTTAGRTERSGYRLLWRHAAVTNRIYYEAPTAKADACINFTASIVPVARPPTPVTTTHAYNVKHHYISIPITSSSDGTITWFPINDQYINGFCIN